MPENFGRDSREAEQADECEGQEFRLRSHAPIIPHSR
jgi:hypothetical protein